MSIHGNATGACRVCGGPVAEWNKHRICLRTPACGVAYRAARRADEYTTGRMAVPPEPAPVPRRRCFESYYKREYPDLTPRRWVLAAFRLVTVHRYLRWVALQQRGIAMWEAAGGKLSGKPRPSMGTVGGFCGWYVATARRAGVCFSERTCRQWLGRYFSDGPAALIDYRGVRVGNGARVDGALWWRLIRGVVAGKSIAAMDRTLRPVAEKRRADWPSLRVLQLRYRAVRELVARNAALFQAGG